MFHLSSSRFLKTVVVLVWVLVCVSTAAADAGVNEQDSIDLINDPPKDETMEGGTTTDPPEGGFLRRLGLGTSAGKTASRSCAQQQQQSGSCTGGSECFPGFSLVTVLGPMTNDPKSLRVDQVQVGDLVLSADAQGMPTYQEVTFLPHLKNELPAEYFQLVCTAVEDHDNTDHHEFSVHLTANHFLLAVSAELEEPHVTTEELGSATMVPAHEVQKGDFLWITNPEHKGSLEPCQVMATSRVHNTDGAYSIFTKNGQVVVDQVLVSSYIQTTKGWMAGHSHSFAHSTVGTLYNTMHWCGVTDTTFFRNIHDNVFVPVKNWF